MKGYIKITADDRGEFQGVGCEAEISIARCIEERAMLVQTLCDALHIDTRNRRTMRKLLRAMRKLKTAKPSGETQMQAKNATVINVNADGTAPDVSVSADGVCIGFRGGKIPPFSTEAQE